MLTVTNAAAAHFKSMLDEVQPEEGSLLRLQAKGQGYKLALDRERPGDSKVRYAEQDVLVADAAVTNRLAGKVIDAQVQDDGAVILIRSTQSREV